MPGINATRGPHFATRTRERRKIIDGPLPVAEVTEEGRVQRLARLMALTIKIGGHIASGAIADLPKAASFGHVTRARMTQIANLLQLAPDMPPALGAPESRVEIGRGSGGENLPAAVRGLPPPRHRSKQTPIGRYITSTGTACRIGWFGGHAMEYAGCPGNRDTRRVSTIRPRSSRSMPSGFMRCLSPTRNSSPATARSWILIHDASTTPPSRRSPR